MQQQVTGTTCRVDMTTNIYATTTLLTEPQQLLATSTTNTYYDTCITTYTDIYNGKKSKASLNYLLRTITHVKLRTYYLLSI